MRDTEFETWLLGRLAGVEIPAFVAPTEPETRAIAELKDILRPSGMYKCERQLAILAGSVPFESTIDAALRTKFDFGTHIHKTIQAALPEYLHEVQIQGPWLKGSLDTSADGGTRVLDYKTADKKTFRAVIKAGEAREDHVKQISWYGRHHRAELVTVIYVLKDTETSTTFDADHVAAFTSAVPGGEHEFDAKAERIKAHLKAGSLPAFEPALECRWCSVKEACCKAKPQEMEFHTKLVGQTFREGLDLAAIGLEEGQELTLAWEPENTYGSRITEDQGAAIKVLAGDRQLGYVPDTGVPTAQIIARHIKAGGRTKAVITDLTSGVAGKENRGVNLLVLLSE